MAWIHDRYTLNNRLQLGNNEYLRTLQMGSEWQSLRIGIRYSVVDAARTTVGNWGLIVGVCNGLSGIQAASTTDYMGGGIFGAAVPSGTTGGISMAFNASTPNYYSMSNAPNCVYKTGSTYLYGGASVVTHYIPGSGAGGAYATQVMGQLFVDIQKGSPNYTLQVWYTNAAATAQTHVTDAVFMSNLETWTSTNLTGGGAKTLAYAGNGLFDTLSIAHYRAWPPIEIDMIGIARWS